VAAAPELVVGHMLDAWSGDGFAFPDDVRAAYVAPFRNPATVHAVCEEYRAAHSLDATHDRADRESGVRIACPVLALSSSGTVAAWFDPMAVWREWAGDVEGALVDAGRWGPRQGAGDRPGEGPALVELPPSSRHQVVERPDATVLEVVFVPVEQQPGTTALVQRDELRHLLRLPDVVPARPPPEPKGVHGVFAAVGDPLEHAGEPNRRCHVRCRPRGQRCCRRGPGTRRPGHLRPADRCLWRPPRSPRTG
jgi:hypothetical protein